MAIATRTRADSGGLASRGTRAAPNACGLETEPDASGTPTRIEALSTVFMTPDYFQVAEMHLVAGRAPDPHAVTAEWKEQMAALSPEIVVNQELAERLWPDGNAVGQRVRQS